MNGVNKERVVGTKQADTKEVDKYCFQGKLIFEETYVKEMLTGMYIQRLTENNYIKHESEDIKKMVHN